VRTLATILCIVLIVPQMAGAQNDSTYAIELNAAVGPSFSVFDHERYEGAPEYTMFGAAFTLRAMWHPGRLLAVGLMTGYTRIASETLLADSNHSGLFPTRATLTSIPLQAVVSMQGPQLEVGVGMGPHIMMTTIDDGMPAHGSRIELNLTLLASYRWHLTPDLFIAPELRLSYFSYRGVLSIIPSFTVRYDILRY